MVLDRMVAYAVYNPVCPLTLAAFRLYVRLLSAPSVLAASVPAAAAADPPASKPAVTLLANGGPVGKGFVDAQAWSSGHSK